MNDRIKELITQAGGHWNHGDFNMPSSVEFQEQDIEKFAELIVKECMACSTWVGRMNKYAIEPVHTAHTINQRIRQHFGVE